MSRRFACLGVAALTVAALLVAADPASAQFRRGFFNRYGNSYYGGYGPVYYSDGSDFYPGYSGWYATDFRGGVPSYYSEGTEGAFFSPFAGASFGSYGAFSGAGVDNNVLINVRVPPNAEVWFDDQKTSQTGSFRSFISPPLDSDRNFVYHIRARWTVDGRQVEKVRNIQVHPGDRLFVTFIRPRPEGTRGTSSDQFGTEPQTRGVDGSFERSNPTQEGKDRDQ